MRFVIEVEKLQFFGDVLVANLMLNIEHIECAMCYLISLDVYFMFVCSPQMYHLFYHCHTSIHTHINTQHKNQHKTITTNQTLKQVARLYRKSLKTLASWCIDRGVFLEKADELRSRFDAERGCDFAKASRLLRVSCNLVM